MTDKTVQITVCCPEDLPDEIQCFPGAKNQIIKHNGSIYLLSGHAVYSCPDDADGNELIYNLFLSIKGHAPDAGSREEIFYRILYEPEYVPDQILLKKHRIDPNQKRQIVVFRSYTSINKDMDTLFSEIAPMEPGDISVPVDYHTVALIKSLKYQTEEDLREYTEAVIGTMEDEGISGIKAGIGKAGMDSDALRDSFREALDALSVGIISHNRDNVFLYSRQTLDRILSSIPDEKMRHIRKSLFSNCTGGRLSDEMLETVRVFFQNDLNLTAASKQLFIHRNTLKYRLDKIKKETGLDLRSFEDAVIFRIVSAFPQSDSTELP